MKEHIIIDGVDTDMLEKQRKTLPKILEVLHGREPHTTLNREERDALEGIMNMLDSWSDDRYYGRSPKFHVATVDTEHFSFLALGVTKSDARQTLLEGWRKHCLEYKAADILHVTAEDISIHELSPGECLRDGRTVYYGGTPVAQTTPVHTAKAGISAYRATFYDVLDLVPAAWSHWFFVLFSESAPFSWGDNNLTLVTTGRFLDHCKDAIEPDLEEHGISEDEWNAFKAAVTNLGPLDTTYIELEGGGIIQAPEL